MMSLTLLILSKDIEKNLTLTIESTRKLVQEIVVVDVLSSKRTAEIAQNYNATYIKASRGMDFSSAKNLGRGHATGEWILCLESGDTLSKEATLDGALSDSSIDAYAVERVGGFLSSEAFKDLSPVLFRNKPSIRFVGEVNEEVYPTVNPEALGQIDLKVTTTKPAGDPAHLLELCKRQLASDPENERTLFFAGKYAFQVGKRVESIDFLNRATSANRRPLFSLLAALTLLKMSLHARSTEAYTFVAMAKTLTEKFSHDPEIRMQARLVGSIAELNFLVEKTLGLVQQQARLQNSYTF
jgi:glycosyltransferase involved in cell wall biosynthesis